MTDQRARPIRIPGRLPSLLTSCALVLLTAMVAGPFGFVTLVSVKSLYAGGPSRTYALLAFVLIGVPFLGWLQRFLGNLIFARPRVVKALGGGKVITLSRVQRRNGLSDAEISVYRFVQDITERAGLKASPRVLIVSDDRLNAFAIGGRRSFLIAVTLGVLSRLPPHAAAAVVGHEVGHILHGDSFNKTVALALVDSVAAFLISPLASAHSILRASRTPMMLLTLGLVYALWKGDGPLAMILGCAVFLPQVARVVLLLCQASVASFSRWREFSADSVGAALTSREAMVDALCHLADDGGRRIVVRNPLYTPGVALFGIKDSLVFAGLGRRLFATHPSIQARVDAVTAQSRR